MKVCNKCKQKKPFEEFHKYGKSKDGLQSWCKDCVKQYYEQNKESIREQRKQYREQNKESIKQYYEQNKERIKERNKQHYEQNKESIQEQQRQYREQNKESISEKQKQYYEQNKERIQEQNKQYREQNKESLQEYRRTPPGKFSEYKSGAKQRGIEFHLTEEQFESFWQKPCEYCGAEIETIGLDRLDSDGHYTIDNVVSCCWSCNKSKGRKTLEEWKKDLDNRKINC